MLLQHDSSLDMTYDLSNVMGAIPLNTCKDCSNVVCWTPPILQNVQTQFTCAIDIWMKHLANELDSWRFIGVCLLEMHHKSKGAVFVRSISRPDDHSVPSLCVSRVAE